MSLSLLALREPSFAALPLPLLLGPYLDTDSDKGAGCRVGHPIWWAISAYASCLKVVWLFA